MSPLNPAAACNLSSTKDSSRLSSLLIYHQVAPPHSFSEPRRVDTTNGPFALNTRTLASPGQLATAFHEHFWPLWIWPPDCAGEIHHNPQPSQPCATKLFWPHHRAHRANKPTAHSGV